MKAIQLFGRILRSTHDYVGWVEESHASFVQKACLEILKEEKIEFSEFLLEKYSDRDCSWCCAMKVHSFNSLPMDKRWFERGEEPQLEDYCEADFMNICEEGGKEEVEKRWYADYESWQNWTPLLEGDWEIVENFEATKYLVISNSKKIRFVIEKYSTLNDFITHCNKQGIELVINPEFEIK
jgi:hypothetical protein